MKFLLSSSSRPRQTRPVSMILQRRIKPGRLDDFERGLQQFVTFAASFPGHLELCVAHAANRPLRDDYLVIDRFIDAETRQAFTATSHYRAWLRLVSDFTESIPSEHDPIDLHAVSAASSLSIADPNPPSFDQAFPAASRPFPSRTESRACGPSILLPRILTALFSLASVGALAMAVIDSISPTWHPFARSAFAVGMIIPALTAGLWCLVGDFRRTRTSLRRA